MDAVPVSFPVIKHFLNSDVFADRLPGKIGGVLERKFTEGERLWAERLAPVLAEKQTLDSLTETSGAVATVERWQRRLNAALVGPPVELLDEEHVLLVRAITTAGQVSSYTLMPSARMTPALWRSLATLIDDVLEANGHRPDVPDVPPPLGTGRETE